MFIEDRYEVQIVEDSDVLGLQNGVWRTFVSK